MCKQCCLLKASHSGQSRAWRADGKAEVYKTSQAHKTPTGSCFMMLASLRAISLLTINSTCTVSLSTTSEIKQRSSPTPAHLLLPTSSHQGITWLPQWMGIRMPECVWWGQVCCICFYSGTSWWPMVPLDL